MAVTDITPEAAARSAELIAKANNGKKVPDQSDMGKLNGDFNFFLKMLTTQLQNQDPTEPMDVSQMTQQIAQYSGVEQQIKTNNQLAALLNSNKQSQLSTAVSYIGKEIETEGDTGTLKYATDGGTHGVASFEYTLPEGVKTATIKILNEAGEVVFTGAGSVAAGKNTVTWDGVGTDKELQPEGDYSIEVIAKDEQDEDMGTIETGGEEEMVHEVNNFGQAVFAYFLPKGVTGAKITITNSAGGAVFQGDGTLKEGRNVVVWDGKNSFTGEQAPGGQYSIKVTGKDSAGKDISYESRAVGVVENVENDGEGNILLTVNGVIVKYEEILAVREPTPFM